METKTTSDMISKLMPDTHLINEIIDSVEKKTGETGNNLQPDRQQWLNDLLIMLTTRTGKKNFLVSKSKKYVNVPTESIAYFCIKYDSAMIMCFDNQEYFVHYSLDQIENLISEKQFYRLNRQYLINFNAIKEIERFFARKLLVKCTIPPKDKLIVPKERVTGFLYWLDNR